MHSPKLIVIFFCLTFSLSLLSCQHGRKFYGHHKRSKWDVRQGPDRHQQEQQGAWEALLAKKSAKERQKQQADPALVSAQVAQALVNLSEMKWPEHTVPNLPKQQHNTFRMGGRPCSAPVMTTMLLMLLLMAPTCKAQIELGAIVINVLPAAVGVVAGLFKSIFSGDNNIDCDVCAQYAELLNNAGPKIWKLSDVSSEYNCGSFKTIPLSRADASQCRRIRGVASDACEFYSGTMKEQLAQYNSDIQGITSCLATCQQRFGSLEPVQRYIGWQDRVYKINSPYAQIFSAFSKDKCKAMVDSEPLVKIGSRLGSYMQGVIEHQNSDEYKEWGDKLGLRILEILRTNDAYVEILKGMLRSIATGDYDDTLKHGAKEILEHIDNDSCDVDDPACVKVFANFMRVARTVDLAHLKARLDELSLGLLYSASSLGCPAQDKDKDWLSRDACHNGVRILCSSEGLCGISDTIASELGGAKLSFEKFDTLIKGQLARRINSAQDILEIFTHGGEYRGRPHVAEGPIDMHIRTVTSDGIIETFKLAAACASENIVVKSRDRQNSQLPIYMVVLDDGTKMSYLPTDLQGNSVIKITGLPTWISGDSLEFRYPMKDGEEITEHDYKFIDDVLIKLGAVFIKEGSRAQLSGGDSVDILSRLKQGDSG